MKGKKTTHNEESSQKPQKERAKKLQETKNEIKNAMTMQVLIFQLPCPHLYKGLFFQFYYVDTPVIIHKRKQPNLAIGQKGKHTI